MAKLTIREGGKSTVYEILDEVVSIGRREGMSVRVSDPHVGSEHCQIRQVPGVGYKLIDLESRNGTKVNGKFVNQHVLANGDEIELGEVKITFAGGAPQPAAARPAAAAPPVARAAPAAAWLFLAMTQQRLGATQETKRALEQFAAAAPNPEDDDERFPRWFLTAFEGKLQSEAKQRLETASSASAN